MTVIAWDGETLAADKAATNVGHARTVTKIFRVPGGLVGFSGDASGAMALLEWFRNGRVPANFPKLQDDENTEASALFIDEAGKQFIYCRGPNPEHIEDTQVAMGSGRDYALAAMYLGCNARLAIEVACALDINCGKGIDTLTLEPA